MLDDVGAGLFVVVATAAVDVVQIAGLVLTDGEGEYVGAVLVVGGTGTVTKRLIGTCAADYWPTIRPGEVVDAPFVVGVGPTLSCVC